MTRSPSGSSLSSSLVREIEVSSVWHDRYHLLLNKDIFKEFGTTNIGLHKADKFIRQAYDLYYQQRKK